MSIAGCFCFFIAGVHGAGIAGTIRRCFGPFYSEGELPLELFDLLLVVYFEVFVPL